MYRLKYCQKGFTITEILVATSVIALLVGGTIAIYIRCLKVWEEGSMEASLQRNANTTMEKMVRGIDGMDGIREAKLVALPNANTIQYTSGIDSKERSFYLNGSQIMYDPDTSISGDEYSITDNVRTSPAGLTFTISGNLVSINLGMEGRIMDKIIPVNLHTEVTLRN